MRFHSWVTEFLGGVGRKTLINRDAMERRTRTAYRSEPNQLYNTIDNDRTCVNRKGLTQKVQSEEDAGRYLGNGFAQKERAAKIIWREEASYLTAAPAEHRAVDNVGRARRKFQSRGVDGARRRTLRRHLAQRWRQPRCLAELSEHKFERQPASRQQMECGVEACAARAQSVEREGGRPKESGSCSPAFRDSFEALGMSLLPFPTANGLWAAAVGKSF